MIIHISCNFLFTVQEDENFIPTPPPCKDIKSLYKAFERPVLVKKKSEKTFREFQEKHKKLAASFNNHREFKVEEALNRIKNKISPPNTDSKVCIPC